MSRGTTAYINLAALNHNLNRVRSLVDHRSVLAMIKSNGYGHGLLRVASALKAADAFGVASLDEAMVLREAAIKKPIVVMSGFYSAAELRHFVEHDIAAVIHHSRQLDILEKTALKKPLSVWLKVDTGMHRLGFLPTEFNEAMLRLHQSQSVDSSMGLMTHLADADNKAVHFTQSQIAKFHSLTRAIDLPKSIANSAAILAHPDALTDWVRPGIMLYGVSPLADCSAEQAGLQPVMTLTARLIAVKSLSKGDPIGYGCTWCCPEAMPVGVVSIGYGDGYPRHAKNGTPTLLNGVLCPLVGRVSMDMIVIDLRTQANAKVGDTVILWGQGLPIERVAACADTIPYELLCSVTQRVAFEETGSE